VQKTTASRLSHLRTKMDQMGVGLVALGPGAHMQWLLGFHPHPDERPCLLLIGPERAALLMPALNAEGMRPRTDLPFHSWSDDEGPDAALKSALADVGGFAARDIVLDETMRADFALLLLGHLGQARHKFTADTVGALRMRKDAGEFAALKENALIADRAMQAGFTALTPGVRERDVQEAIKTHFASEGAPMLFGIVGFGPNGAFPHHQTSDRSLQEGDTVLMDIGGRKNGFHSDITRMALIGQPPAGYDEVHAIVEAALQAAMNVARPGTRACDLDAAARGVITDAGYGEYFVHRTGHGLGVDIHEPPYITATSETVLQTGMVFSIEPGIYLPGRFGIRLEDIVILRDDGPEILSELSRDPIRISVSKVAG
jgi:Xaa-Pro aminopeptidase